MNRVKRAVHAADTLQQRHAWLAVPVAVWKKFGDDQAGNQAALIAYYSFVAIFPLLLVLVTVLNIVLKNDPGLQHRLLNSALGQYPVIGPQLGHISPLTQTGLPLVVGLLGTFFGARGVATAIQNALNTVWEIPYRTPAGLPVVVAAQLRADGGHRPGPDRDHGGILSGAAGRGAAPPRRLRPRGHRGHGGGGAGSARETARVRPGPAGHARRDSG